MIRFTPVRGRAALLAGTALVAGFVAAPAFARQAFVPNTLVVSRIVYAGDTNPARAGESFPTIFNDPNVSGVQGSIFLDSYRTEPFSRPVASLALSAQSGAGGGPIITTSFSSKSEGSLNLSADGRFLTYMGYVGPVGAEGVSNSETTNPAAELVPPVGPFFDRAVALVKFDGSFLVQPESNAFSGDNPRGAITIDGTQFYMAGNSDSTENPDGSGPGTTIGVRLGAPGSAASTQLGTYDATDRPDESKKKHIKDNNWRGIGLFNGNLYVAKGSGGNGDDGVFQVENGTANGIPAGGSNNSIVQLVGTQATNPVTGASSPLTPFGFFFADANTLYIADEGNSTITTSTPGGTVISSATDGSGNTTYTDLVSDPLAGLQKWSLVGGVWTLDYVLQAGLQLDEPQQVPGYPAPTYTTGLRNLTGKVNDDGTVTIYAITAQTSAISGGEPDPTRLVAITDRLAATSLPLHDHDGDGFDRDRDRDRDNDARLESFVTLQASRSGEVFRGVAFAPQP